MYAQQKICLGASAKLCSSLSLQAETFDGTGQPIMAIKGARLSDFGGRSLSTQFSSTVMINPELPEAYKLRGWLVVFPLPLLIFYSQIVQYRNCSIKV